MGLVFNLLARNVHWTEAQVNPSAGPDVVVKIKISALTAN
jgi:hypothetical protein